MDRKRTVRPGERGEEILERTERSVDLDDISQEEVIESPFFCSCGEPMDEETVERCSRCDTLMCQSCAVRSDGRTLCRECAAERFHGLDRPDFQILLAIENGIHDEEKIAGVTELEPEEVRERIDEMKNPLIRERRSMFGFLKVNKNLSPKGHEALDVYRQIYGDEPSVVEFKERLRVLGVLR